MKKLTAVLALSLMLAAPTFAYAQDAHKSWKDMTESERAEHKAAMKEEFDKMSPEEKHKFKEERRAKMKARYDAATPEEQAHIRQRMKERREHRQGSNTSSDAK